MWKYYVNKEAQSSGEHEVHREDCTHLPISRNQHFLGYYIDCYDALRKAREKYTEVDGCFYCCPACHTR